MSPRREIKAAVAYWGTHCEGGGTLVDISTSGALIEPASPTVPEGTALRLFVNGIEFSSLELASEVVRTTGRGFAVQFQDLGPETMRMLEELLD